MEKTENLEEKIKILEDELKVFKSYRDKKENPTEYCLHCEKKGEPMDCLSVFDRKETLCYSQTEKIYVCVYCKPCNLVSIYNRPIPKLREFPV